MIVGEWKGYLHNIVNIIIIYSLKNYKKNFINGLKHTLQNLKLAYNSHTSSPNNGLRFIVNFLTLSLSMDVTSLNLIVLSNPSRSLLVILNFFLRSQNLLVHPLSILECHIFHSIKCGL